MRAFERLVFAAVTAVTVAAAACSSHPALNAVPSDPRDLAHVTPQVIQNGHQPINWMTFSPPTTSHLTAVADGFASNVWFTDYSGQTLNSMNVYGTVMQFPANICAATMAVTVNYGIIPNSCGSTYAAFYPHGSKTEVGYYTSPSGDYSPEDGAAVQGYNVIWFVESKHIASVDCGGCRATEIAYTDGTTLNQGAGIAHAHNDTMWWTSPSENDISTLDQSNGKITNYHITRSCAPTAIVNQDNTNTMYFTCSAANFIGRIGVGSPVHFFPTPVAPGAGPQSITFGSDGNVWFTAAANSGYEIGQLDISTGVITGFAEPAGIYPGYGIASGADGNLWLTSDSDPSGSQIIVYIMHPITVTPSPLTLNAVGDMATLTVSSSNPNATSSNTSVATVAPVSGEPDELEVTATGVGSCIVSVSFGLNIYQERVTVK